MLGRQFTCRSPERPWWGWSDACGALTAASHRAQEVEPGMPKGSAEPLEE